MLIVMTDRLHPNNKHPPLSVYCDTARSPLSPVPGSGDESRSSAVASVRCSRPQHPHIPPAQLFREQLCLKLSSVRDKLATKTIQKLVYCVNNI